MNYEGQICRPPMERASFMLPVAVGCSYNRCTFCTLFKHLKFRTLPLSQVEEELKRVQSLGGYPKRIFLGDGNPFGLSTGHLAELLALIHKYFPRCMDIGMDATITNIGEKSDEELRFLYENGVQNVYIGIECGTEDVLRFLKKDHTVAEAYKQLARLEKSGIYYNAHLMLGTAGAGRGMENAENTAEFINRTRPRRIINTSIFLHERAPLYRDIISGRFVPAAELENLREERRFIELLTAEIEHYDGFHDWLEVRTRGQLPRDKERMLAHLDEAISEEEKRNTPCSILHEPECWPAAADKAEINGPEDAGTGETGSGAAADKKEKRKALYVYDRSRG